MQPQCLPCYSLNTPNIPSLKVLCTCCLLSLKDSPSRYPPDLLSCFFPDSVQGGLLWQMNIHEYAFCDAQPSLLPLTSFSFPHCVYHCLTYYSMYVCLFVYYLHYLTRMLAPGKQRLFCSFLALSPAIDYRMVNDQWIPILITWMKEWISW